MPITKLFRHLKTVCFQSKFILVKEIIQMLFKVSGYKLYRYNPANIYLFKVNHRSTRKRCEIFSKLAIKTPERRQRQKC